MATVDGNDCDGCGREFTAAELYPVTMPSGDEAVCCPECRRYAKTAARKQAELVAQDECDGCGERRTRAELVAVELPDGVTIDCCESCAREARAVAESATERATAQTDELEGGDGDEIADARVDENERGDVPAVRGKHRCEQCREWFSDELFEVVTVDGRTERFCETCKENARYDGVVTKVKMRKAEAYDVLGVDRGVSVTRLRERYIAQVKRVHPDREGGSDEAFKRVQRAYERLTD